MLVLGPLLLVEAVVVALLISRRGPQSPGRTLASVAIWTGALLAGVLVTFVLGLGCFHCTGWAPVVMVFGGGVLATIVLGSVGELVAGWLWRRLGS